MLSIDEKLRKMIDLSGEIMRYGRNSLLVNLRFMDAALSRLVPVAVYEGMTVETYAYEGEEEVHIGELFSGCTMASDGQFLAYSPVYILNGYREERTRPARDILHAVMHCVFRHMYIHSPADRRCWDLACDIAVENAIAELNVPAVHCGREDRQRFVINGLKNDVGMITAEKLYRYYFDKKLSGERMAELETLFRADEHDLWYLPPAVKVSISAVLENSAVQQAAQNRQKDGQAQSGEESSLRSSILSPGEAEKDWKNVSERMQTDLETFNRLRGDGTGGMMQNLKEVNREKYDYTEFLKKFAVMGEVMKINDDEFDYIFYTYGLKLYENMPLIEPLEYKEAKRIREFVIAIDTSGSVQGKEVQAFITKTYNIMKSTESFFSRVNVHILQCDAEVQEHVKITSQEEFEEYIKHMKLHGFGGTDFRPVFSLTEKLQQQKEFMNLKGLIYFTDGYGLFPEKKPPFETAFVFVRNGYEIPSVPPWAIRLVLQKEDI